MSPCLAAASSTVGSELTWRAHVVHDASSMSELVAETCEQHAGYSMAYALRVLRSSMIDVDPDGETLDET